MYHKIKFTSFLLIVCSSILAQTDTIKLDHFRAPTNPAMVLLGLGTQSITRPTTTKGVATSLVSGFAGNTFSPNVALEINPFWLKNHPELTFEDYYNMGNDKSKTSKPPNIMQNISESFSFSIATSKIGDNKDTLIGTRIGLGVRAQILSGNLSDSARNKIIRYSNQIDAMSALRSVIKDELGKLRNDSVYTTDSLRNLVFNSILSLSIQRIKANQSTDSEEKKIQIEEATKLLELKKKQLENLPMSEVLKNMESDFSDRTDLALSIQKISEESKNKVGIIWEIAGAGSQYFPDNNFNHSLTNKLGLWSTLSYRSENQKDEFSILARYLVNKNDSTTKNIDFGCSYNRLINKNFNYGFEAIIRSSEYRYDTKDLSGNPIKAIQSNTTWRFAFTIEYKINDMIVLNSSIGKDFDGLIVQRGNLLALIGANFSLPSIANLLLTKN